MLLLYGNEVWSLQKPASADPCAACLGPGFISIMRSIYSVVVTRGEEKSQILFKTQGTSAKSCLKGRANSLMKLAWYVCARKPLSCAGYRCQENRQTPALKRTAGPQTRRRAWISYQDYVYAPDLISSPHRTVITCVFTSEPPYRSVECGLFFLECESHSSEVCFWSLQLSESEASWAWLSPFTLRENEISPFIY